jgi:hypothetical protein
VQNVETVRLANRNLVPTLVTAGKRARCGAAVMRFRDLTTDKIRPFNGFSIIARGLPLLVSVAVVTPFGHFLLEPQLPVVLVVMSSAFVMDRGRGMALYCRVVQ